jgi:ribosomal protein S18 acetylase RimI-like enzyme
VDDETIERLTADDMRAALDELAGLLHDCVEGGASVSFVHPFTRDDARGFFASLLPEVEAGTRVLLAARDGGGIVGSVQLIHASPPNQPHRGDIAKLLVHRRARGRGIARRLMAAAEDAARADGKTLLVLDTVTGSPAYRLYESLGWVAVGEIPGYALDVHGTLEPTTVFYKQL